MEISHKWKSLLLLMINIMKRVLYSSSKWFLKSLLYVHLHVQILSSIVMEPNTKDVYIYSVNIMERLTMAKM